MKPKNPGIRDARAHIGVVMREFATREEGFLSIAALSEGDERIDALARAQEMKLAKEMMQGILLALEKNPGR